MEVGKGFVSGLVLQVESTEVADSLEGESTRSSEMGKRSHEWVLAWAAG